MSADREPVGPLSEPLAEPSSVEPSGGSDAAPPAPQVIPPVPKPKAPPPAIAEFQSDALELESRAPPRVARLTLYLISALIVCAVAWAALSSMDEVVVARGKLITTRPTLVVQPLERSVIRSIDVGVGEVVRAGQTLARLDATFVQSDADQLRTRLRSFDAQVHRLSAEANDRPYVPPPAPTHEDDLQAALYGQRRAYVDAQLRNYDKQIAGAQAVLATSAQEEKALTLRQATLGQIEKMQATLVQHQTGSRLKLLQARDSRQDLDASLVRVRGTKVAERRNYEKSMADRQAFLEDFRRRTLEELVAADRQRSATIDELRKVERRKDLVVLTAPSDAIVLDLAQRSIGSVVREAEPLMTLVPLDVPLEAEVAIDSRDIGHVVTGETAKIKLDAFPFQKYGTLSGAVRTIAADASSVDVKADQAATAAPMIYKARITLTDTDLRGLKGPVRLLPGMTMAAEITVGRRSVISYFLYPLIRGFDESLREP
jgi:HlyD family secretion protein